MAHAWSTCAFSVTVVALWCCTGATALRGHGAGSLQIAHGDALLQSGTRSLRQQRRHVTAADAQPAHHRSHKGHRLETDLKDERRDAATPASVYENIISELQRRARLSDQAYMSLPQLLQFLAEEYDGIELGPDTLLQPPSYTGFADIDDVMFVVMGSQQSRARAESLSQSWMQWIKHGFIVAETDDEALRMRAIPGLEAEYEEGWSAKVRANLRHVAALRWVVESEAQWGNKSWIALVDDDTWVNVPLLLRLLRPLHRDLPVALGSFMEDKQGHFAWFGGGAGMVFTTAAAKAIGPRLRTPECPFIMDNDVTLARCAHQVGVVKVHSNEFDGHNSGADGFTPWYAKATCHKPPVDAVLLSQFSCDAAQAYGYPLLPSCSS